MEAGTIGAAASDIDPEHWFSIAGQLIEDEEDIELATVHLSKIQMWLEAYKNDMQNSLNDFSGQLKRYETEMQSQIAKYQGDVQSKIEYMKTHSEVSVQNTAKTLEAIAMKNNSRIQKYTGQVQSYRSQIEQSVQDFMARVQATGATYEWAQSRYTMLKQDYNGAFVGAPQQQQQQGGQEGGR